MVTQYDCNVCPILAPKILNKGGGGGGARGHKFKARSNTKTVKLILIFIHIYLILNLMFKCKNQIASIITSIVPND